eukprot:1194473-Prorocentrum_minimum.AAC.2
MSPRHLIDVANEIEVETIRVGSLILETTPTNPVPWQQRCVSRGDPLVGEITTQVVKVAPPNDME